MSDAGIGRIVTVIIGGIDDGYCALHGRCGNCQRDFELLRDRPGRMDRLADFRLHRRSPADLDGPGDTACLRTFGHPRRSKRMLAAAEARTAKRYGKEEIMTHVLIVMSWFGAVNGAVISTQEFTNAERCEAARQTLIEYAKARGLDETLRPICKQK